MTQLLLGPPSGASAPSERDIRTFHGGGLTLDERISGVWEGLRAVGTADCPLCGERMESERDGGRCTGCRSILR